MKHLATIVLVLAIASPVAAGPKLPAHYAKLFDPRSTWTYEVTPSGSDKSMEVTCHVARVVTFGRVTASEVVCDGTDDTLPIANVYLARSDGLYTSGLGYPTTREEIGDFSMHMFVIAAKPKRTSKTVRRYGIIDDKPITEDTTFETKRDGNAWCWVGTTKRGSYTSVNSRCFAGALDHGVDHGQAFQLRPSS